LAYFAPWPFNSTLPDVCKVFFVSHSRRLVMESWKPSDCSVGIPRGGGEGDATDIVAGVAPGGVGSNAARSLVEFPVADEIGFAEDQCVVGGTPARLIVVTDGVGRERRAEPIAPAGRSPGCKKRFLIPGKLRVFDYTGWVRCRPRFKLFYARIGQAPLLAVFAS